MFDIKLLVASVFLIFSVLLILNSQNRTNIVTTLIIIHLNLIVFFSLTVTNQNLFKEIILTLVLYLIAVLFIITNQEDIAKTIKKIKVKGPSLQTIIIAAFISIAIFICSFILTNKAFHAMRKMRENNVVILSEVKDQAASAQASLKDRKIMRLAKKLHENYLLKHSSDVILIIVFLSGSILLFSSYNLPKKK